MKIKALLLLLILSVSISVSAQQKIISDNIGEIAEIALSGKLNVSYIPSDKNSIEINLYNTDIEKLRWEVVNGELSVTLKPSGRDKGYADVKIWCKSSINKFDISEASFISDSTIKAGMIDLIVSSSAKVTATFDVIDMKVKISASSIVSLLGDSKYVDITATENSRLDIRKMNVVSCEITSASGAEVYADVEERLYATAKSGSTIFYSGDPIVMRLNTPKVTGLGAGIHKLK